MYIAVDFDGTIVEHEYPEIGRPIPGAIEWMKKWQDAGAKIILWTMRSNSPKSGPTLAEAVSYLRRNGIEPYGVNTNPTQGKWTESPKAYANVYVDDAAAGCPLRPSAAMAGRPMVDWDIVGPMVMTKLISASAA